jgi:hypothetical protein
MSFCAACGIEIAGDGALCAYHRGRRGDGWAENNRCMCDLLHRGRVPPRLPPPDREEQFDEVA